jgi:phosphotransferase system HPr (HPr) family protein
MLEMTFPPAERIECLVADAQGLHARPCTRLARAIGKFRRCEVRVEWNGKTADAKSVLELMRLTAPRGARLTFVVAGADTQRCVAAVTAAMAAALIPKAS